MIRPMTVNRQPSMERYQVILAYDGSHFKGFQRQARARSVQGVVEDALRKLSWQGTSILAAGRTDTGVHATGQVIAFDLDWSHTPHDLLNALNSYLPADVVARQVRQVCPAFHPRYDASWRKYSYRIYCQSVREPLLEPHAWRVWPAVDVLALQAAAQPLPGTHDFDAFGTPPHAGGSTTRVVLHADWKSEAPFFVFEITGQAFLYHMVRHIVFIQVMVAQGRLAVEELVRALDTGIGFNTQPDPVQDRSHRLVHGMAPPQGLVLVEVSYPPASYLLAEDSK